MLTPAFVADAFPSLVADQVALAVDNALRHDEQRTGELFLEEGQKLSHTGSWVWNLKTGEIKWPREHFLILGADPGKDKSCTPLFWNRVHPDLIVPDGHREDSEKVREALQRGARVNAELTRKRKDGSRITGSFVASPVRVEGNTPEIYGIYRDITERKKSEDALRRSEAVSPKSSKPVA